MHRPSRRDVLGAIGITGATGLAGCGAGTDGQPTEDPATGTPGPPASDTPSETTATETPVSDLVEPTAKLVPDDGDPEDYFSEELAVTEDGRTAIVGVPFEEDPNGEFAGAAYVFTQDESGWRQATKLAPEDGNSGDYFGSSVAVSGDGTTAIVGATKEGALDETGDVGAAYVYSREGDGWHRRAILAPDDGEPKDLFGESLALSADGTTAAIASPNATGDVEGAVYVFSRTADGWRQQTRLTLDVEHPDLRDDFGVTVSISGDGTTVVTGAELGVESYDPSAMFVFSRGADGWRQQAELAPRESEETFSSTVALSEDGTTALVGARYDENGHGVDAGAAYVFSQGADGWRQQGKFVPDDGDEDDQFGCAVALSGDGTTALVGARNDEDPNGEFAGSAYVFSQEGDGWGQRAKYAADDGDEGDRFGWEVAISGDGSTAIVGAGRDEDPNGADAGAAYVFQ